MKISTSEAALLNATELALVRSKGPWYVKDLVSLIGRARKLRDKQRDQLQRQRIISARNTGTKDGKSGKANVRTAAKADLMDRVLKHFEAELEKIKRESAEASRCLKSERLASRKVAEPARKPGKKATRKVAVPPARKTPAKQSRLLG